MSDQLVHVRDKKTGDDLYVGQAWVDRWPDDFDVIPDQAAPAAPVPAPRATSTSDPRYEN